MTESTGRESLFSSLRTDEQIRWIQGRFKLDGLARLARSTPDYYETHGDYLPDVAALAHAALTELYEARGIIALCAADSTAANLAQELECLKASAREVIEYVGCLMPDECGGMHGKCRVCHLRFYLEDKDLVD